MSLKNILYLVRKIDITLLPILLLNKTSIIEIVDILYYLVRCLGLLNIVEDIIVPIKDDYLISWNKTYIYIRDRIN